MRLLVVEDDPDVSRILRRGLTEASYAVDLAGDGETACELAGINPYDAIVLDIMIPAPDGIEVCRRIRMSGSNVPVLMLTARGGVDERIVGLDAGADDYLTKPFELGELLARLRALLRRGAITHAPVLSIGAMEIDTRSHRVRIGPSSLTLTNKEYAVLEYLARNTGRLVTREELSEHVWGDDFDAFSNLVEVYISRLRRQFEKVSSEPFIHTMRGSGYLFESRQLAE